VIISPHTSVDEPASYNAQPGHLLRESAAHCATGTPMPNVFDTTRGY
jgi:hypothetical protein